MPITQAPIRAMSNVIVKYGPAAGTAVDITAACNSAQLAATVGEIETTTLASSGKETTPGQTEWSIDCGGPWSRDLDTAIAPDVVTPPTVKRYASIQFGNSAGNIVTYVWDPAVAPTNSRSANVSSYNIDASNPSESLNWTGTLVLSGAPVRTAS